MSFLKKFDTKDKVHLLKQFFFDYVWKKSSLNLGLASIIFSLCFLQFTIPQFYISATLREAQQSLSNNQSVGGNAAGLLSIMSSEEDSFGEFRSNLYSYVIAQRMWEKGWATEIYAGGDPEKDFNKIVNYMSNDKKNNDNKINFILLKNIGKTALPNKSKISVKSLKKLIKAISQY